MTMPYSSAIEGCRNYYEIGFNDTPRSKVLLSGSVAFDRPFREYVANLKNNHIDKLPHPGYNRRYDEYSPEFVRTNYFHILNKYLCWFVDAHTFRYLHLKNFEIASVGSLLLADDTIQSEMSALGFIDYETCIFSNQQNILKKIAWIVDDQNRATVDKIRLAGMRLARERHLTRHRASQIHALIENAVTR
jgi:Glycosyl transferases group 1